MKKKYYTTGYVTKKLGITKTWLYKLERLKRIPKAKREVISSYRLYTKEDIKRIRKKLKRKGGSKK